MGQAGRRQVDYENIPKEWLNAIVKKDWINKLCEDFAYIVS